MSVPLPDIAMTTATCKLQAHQCSEVYVVTTGNKFMHRLEFLGALA